MHSQQMYFKPQDLHFELAMDEPDDISIEVIARFCGITIDYKPLQGCEANLIGWKDKAVIILNSLSNTSRQRFSFGHELGHWMNNRGTISFRCAEKTFWSEWSAVNPEQRANRYAVDLLLPKPMFQPRAHNKPVTLAAAKFLADEFKMSLTATALRLVELSDYPAIIYCSENKRKKWFSRNNEVPESLWPIEYLRSGSMASDLLQGSETRGPILTRASCWFDRPQARDSVLKEDSILLDNESVLSLIWWEKSDWLIELMGGDEDDLYS